MHNSPNFESQISLDKACLQSSQTTSAFQIPHTTFSKRSDKVKTCETCSSHYIAITKKGKGIALLLAQKSKRHRPPNLESQTPNKITFLKIEEAPLSESQEPDSQQDCFLKNRRGIIFRISRVRSPTRLLVRKPKRHRFPNFESQISLDKASCGDKRNRTRADTSTTLSTSKVSHIIRSALSFGGNQKTLQPSSRISLWKVTSSKAKVSHIISSPFASPYPWCYLRHKEKENNQPEAKVEPPI
ncbi:hypothetical protein ACFX13_047782 [Malus domestica]